jgi:hypothetical protein
VHLPKGPGTRVSIKLVYRAHSKRPLDGNPLSSVSHLMIHADEGLILRCLSNLATLKMSSSCLCGTISGWRGWNMFQ